MLLAPSRRGREVVMVDAALGHADPAALHHSGEPE
jgi:hypothetical protein